MGPTCPSLTVQTNVGRPPAWCSVDVCDCLPCYGWWDAASRDPICSLWTGSIIERASRQFFLRKERVSEQARGRTSWREARRQDLRRWAWRQDLWRRAACQVIVTSASSLRPRRQQRWRRAKSSDFEILPPWTYLWIFFFKKRLKNKKFGSPWA